MKAVGGVTKRDSEGGIGGKISRVYVLLFDPQPVFLASDRAFLLFVCVLVVGLHECFRVADLEQAWDGKEGGRSKGRETRESKTLTNSASYARFSAARVRDWADPIFTELLSSLWMDGCRYGGMHASRKREKSRKEAQKTLWI